jgi:hypothetical protein
MSASVLAAPIGLLGIVLGAVTTYIFGLRAETRRNFQRLRNDAYTDFIKSAALIAIYQRANDEARATDAAALMADAKARIVVFGGSVVGSAVAKFFRSHGTLTSPAAMSSFVRIIASMRTENIRDGKVLPPEDVSQILFGVDLPT